MSKSVHNNDYCKGQIELTLNKLFFFQVIDLLNQAQLEKENKLNCLKQVSLPYATTEYTTEQCSVV